MTATLDRPTTRQITHLPVDTGGSKENLRDRLQYSVYAESYGFKTTASGAANSTAINNASKTGKRVLMGIGTFEFDDTLIPQAEGQIWQGSGGGDADIGGRTILKYTGSDDGKMISFNNAGTHMQNGGLCDMVLNGNNKANIGVELYDDAVAGGAWRQFLRNVSIYGVNHGANPTGVYAGAGTGNDNSNDFLLDHVMVQGSAYGLQSGGAKGHLQGGCTFKANTAAGIWARGGCAIDIGNSLFVDNRWDIIGGSTISGVPTGAQSINGNGGWCEGSGLPASYGADGGIYKSSTSHNITLTGFTLHTANTTQMMDFGGSSGYHAFNGCTLGAGFKSQLIKNINIAATGIVTGQNLTLSCAPGFQTCVAAYFPSYVPSRAQGNAGTWYANGTNCANGETVVLPFRGVGILCVMSTRVSNAALRTATWYQVDLMGADNPAIQIIPAWNGAAAVDSFAVGSGGNATFTIAAGNDATLVSSYGFPASSCIVFTNTAGADVNVIMSINGCAY